MFVNLHTLPAGQHMYTLFLTTDPEGTPGDDLIVEEVDFVAPSNWSLAGVARKARKDGALDDYAPDARVVAVVDQSTGDVVQDLDGDLAEDLG